MQITITDDEALGKNIPIEALVAIEIKKGYKIVNQYTHPAVGRVVVLESGSR
jgi:hypothetical protein